MTSARRGRFSRQLSRLGQVWPGAADLARFRNLAVHRYWEFEHARIYPKLSSRMAALGDFEAEILAFLESYSSPPSSSTTPR